jgi:hypothetical protein
MEIEQVKIKQTNDGKRGTLVIKTQIYCPLDLEDEPSLRREDKIVTLYKTNLVHLDNVPEIIKRFCRFNRHLNHRHLQVEFIPKPIEFELW